MSYVFVLVIFLSMYYLGTIIYLVLEDNKTQRMLSIHEAGHAIASWYATSVTEIESIYITKVKGEVSYRAIRGDNDPNILWIMLVIKLSGIAAEYQYGIKVRAAGCSSDLLSSKDIADKLFKLGSMKCPWKIIKKKTLPFSKMYLKEVLPEENEILCQGYSFARQYLISRTKEHKLLADKILQKKILTESSVAVILGPRSLEKMEYLSDLVGHCFLEAEQR